MNFYFITLLPMHLIFLSIQFQSNIQTCHLPKAIQLCDVELEILEDRASVGHESLELGLYLPEPVFISLGHKRQGCALIGTSGCPAHAVDVAVYIQGKVKVYDVGHKLEVDTP